MARLANRIYVTCIFVTSLKLHDVTVSLLKYSRYMITAKLFAIPWPIITSTHSTLYNLSL